MFCAFDNLHINQLICEVHNSCVTELVCRAYTERATIIQVAPFYGWQCIPSFLCSFLSSWGWCWFLCDVV